jgi:3-deoxy-manno-octulosonate cytidylyltransferase (CMP-KDO synthetase)
MTACVIIPARYASTRFPGKPLVPLLGKPMVVWVAELSARAVGKEHVYVATEDTRIASEVKNAGFTPLMTSANALTGTDRVAEAAKLINYDIYVNVQGDEPLVDPVDILHCIELKEAKPEAILNGFCWIGKDEDPKSINIPKVVMSESGKMIYMSRALLPGFKNEKSAPARYAKQVCIYGFDLKQLSKYREFGRKTTLEDHEDIEILRFLELGDDVFMYECSPGSLAVDVPEDIDKVEDGLAKQLNT